MNNFKESSELEINTRAVPSLFQLSVAVISNFKLWSFAQDVPEEAVPLFLKGIKYIDFNLDHLPNLLPASLRLLDLTGFHSLNEEGIISIIKKCFHLHTLILKDLPLLSDTTISRILQHLPNLLHLSLGAGVDSLSIVDIQRPPNMLTHLEIHSASLDHLWLEHLRNFPHLTTLKLRNVIVPRLQSESFKLPPNLSFVDIMTSSQTSDNTVNLLSFFLTEAPNLLHLTLGGKAGLTTKQIGPIVAKNLRILRGKGAIRVSQAVADAISDTCQQLEEVSGFSLYVSDTQSRPLGVVYVTAGQSAVSFTYTNKKLNHDYTEITARTAWIEGPMEFNGSNYILPMDPCPTLRKLVLVGGTVDVIEMLQLFPNLEELVLRSVKLKLEKLPESAREILGSKLKSLYLHCHKVAEGAIDWLAKSSVLKRVHLKIDKIPEFNSQPISLDNVLRRFPFVEYLTVTNSKEVIISNERNAEDINAVDDHPLKELYLHGRSRVGPIDDRVIFIQLEKLDFNHYKHLQLLSFSYLHIGAQVTLHNRLRGLSVQKTESASFNLPETLWYLRWETIHMHNQVLQTVLKSRNLCSIQVHADIKLKAAAILKNPTKQQPFSKLKYLVPPRQEKIAKTNYLSVFTGINDEVLLVNTLKEMLKSSGSNLSIEELQLIAEMYSKKEISLRSTEPTVNVKIRLASGALLNIICNPGHRVLDLYAFARHAVKLDNKAFDLMTPFKKVLDLSTYNKTIQELDLAYVTLIQSLRDYTPVENELRNFGLANIKLMEVGKNKNASVLNDQGYPKRPSSAVTVNNKNSNTMEVQEDDVTDSECDTNDDSNGENSSECSEEEDDGYYGTQVSDDEEEWMTMFPEPEKEVDPVKLLLEQRNADMIRKSIEFHEKKEREEAILKFEAEQRLIEEEKRRIEEEKVAAMFYSETSMRKLKMLRWQLHKDMAMNGLLPSPQANDPQVVNNNNHLNIQNVVRPIQNSAQNRNDAPPTDEELALMLQQEEFLQEDEFAHSYI